MVDLVFFEHQNSHYLENMVAIVVWFKDDFPKLKKKTLNQKVFFGTYQSRLSKSYMSELLKSGTAYVIDIDFINKVPNKELREQLKVIDEIGQKLVAVEIVSRHKRAEKKKKNDTMNKSSQLSLLSSTNQKSQTLNKT